MGRKLVTAMKEKLGKQLFEVVIQASANGDVVARETIKVCCLNSMAMPGRQTVSCLCNIHSMKQCLAVLSQAGRLCLVDR